MKHNYLKAIPLSLSLAMVLSLPVYAFEKDETVYTKVDEDGDVTYSIVSEQISSSKKETIKDETDLKDIKNVSGDEKFQQSGTTVTWESDGKDIYYEGKTDNTLPVEMNVIYNFDGKDVSVKDIEGKKGHVKITFNYTNNESHSYNGKTVYTPFMVVLGGTLPADTNSNVTITKGKVIDNGKSHMVGGIASPGLYESYKIDELKDFNKIVLEYDTESFELESFYSMISAHMITSDDIDSFMNELNFSSLDELESATNKLIDGAKTLSKGTKEYSKQMNKANDGSQELSKNGKLLKKGASTLKDGIKELYKKTIEDDGLDTLINGILQLNNGAKELNTAVNTKNNDSKITLNQGTESLVSQVKESAYLSAAYGIKANVGKQLSEAISDEALAAQEKAVTEHAQAVSDYTSLMTLKTLGDTLEENKKKLEDGITQTKEGISKIEKGLEALKNNGISTKAEANTALTQAKTKKKEAEAGLKQAEAGKTQAEAGLKQAQAALAALDKNDENYEASKTQLETTIATLKETIKTCETGIQTAKAGITTCDTLISQLETAIPFFDTLDTLEASLPNLEATLSAVKTTQATLKDTIPTDEQIAASKKVMDEKKDVLDKLSASTKAGAKQANSILSLSDEQLAKKVKDYYNNHYKKNSPVNDDIYKGLNSAGAFKTMDSTFSLLNNYEENIEAVSDGIKQLAEGTQTLYDESSSSMNVLKQGIIQLAGGSKELKDGVDTYIDGIDTLADGINKLTDAFTRIVNGTDTLEKGLEEYKSKGIDKLIDTFKDLEDDKDLIKVLTDYANDYTYTKTNASTYKTKFIYIVQKKSE